MGGSADGTRGHCNRSANNQDGGRSWDESQGITLIFKFYDCQPRIMILKNSEGFLSIVKVEIKGTDLVSFDRLTYFLN